MGLVTENVTLVDAIASFSNLPHRESAREFLEGLSTDELEYIAAYFGARTLNPKLGGPNANRNHLAGQIERYERDRRPRGGPDLSCGRESCAVGLANVSHKMIVLLEFLSISAVRHPAAWSASVGCA